jgi:hypothetical protein
MNDAPLGQARQVSGLELTVHYCPDPEIPKSSFHQWTSELDGTVIAATSDLGSWAWVVGPGGVPGSISGVDAGPPSSGQVSGVGAGSSSSSRTDSMARP